MEKEIFLLLVAESTHFIMKLEKHLQNLQIYCKIIPLPNEISAGCGLSIKCNPEDREIIENTLSQENIEVDMYIVEKEGLKKRVEKL